MKRPGVKSGEPMVYRGVHVITDWECCDCGLVHTVLLDRKKKSVTITMFRNDHETIKMRKKK